MGTRIPQGDHAASYHAYNIGRLTHHYLYYFYFYVISIQRVKVFHPPHWGALCHCHPGQECFGVHIMEELQDAIKSFLASQDNLVKLQDSSYSSCSQRIHPMRTQCYCILCSVTQYEPLTQCEQKQWWWCNIILHSWLRKKLGSPHCIWQIAKCSLCRYQCLHHNKE